MLLSLHLRHRLFEVSNDVLGILDAHREWLGESSHMDHQQPQRTEREPRSLSANILSRRRSPHLCRRHPCRIQFLERQAHARPSLRPHRQARGAENPSVRQGLPHLPASKRKGGWFTLSILNVGFPCSRFRTKQRPTPDFTFNLPLPGNMRALSENKIFSNGCSMPLRWLGSTTYRPKVTIQRIALGDGF